MALGDGEVGRGVALAARKEKTMGVGKDAGWRLCVCVHVWHGMKGFLCYFLGIILACGGARPLESSSGRISLKDQQEKRTRTPLLLPCPASPPP